MVCRKIIFQSEVREKLVFSLVFLSKHFRKIFLVVVASCKRFLNPHKSRDEFCNRTFTASLITDKHCNLLHIKPAIVSLIAPFDWSEIFYFYFTHFSLLFYYFFCLLSYKF